MEKSKVYYTTMKTTFKENLPQKLKRLIKTAGLGEIDFEDKYAAIKIHFGEPGNLAFLRPNYAKVVVDAVKELGGKPFLTDCNTLYVGGRKNALDHLDSAYVNGFSPFSTGCHVIIGDGLKGTDEAIVPIDARVNRRLWYILFTPCFTEYKNRLIFFITISTFSLITDNSAIVQSYNTSLHLVHNLPVMGNDQHRRTVFIHFLQKFHNLP